MSYDFAPLLKVPAQSVREPRWAEVFEEQWAHYGRTVYGNMMNRAGIEQVITRLALQPGITTKDIARAIRVYLTTGTRP